MSKRYSKRIIRRNVKDSFKYFFKYILLRILNCLKIIKKGSLHTKSKLDKSIEVSFSRWHFDNYDVRKKRGGLCVYLLWLLIIVLIILFIVALFLLVLDHISTII